MRINYAIFKAKWEKKRPALNDERKKEIKTVEENDHKVNAFSSLNMERQT